MAIVWRPSREVVEAANVSRFMLTHGISTAEELRRRSVEDIAWFWDAVVRDLGIEFSTAYDRVFDSSDGVPWTRWFPGGRLNLAHNCLDRWAERTPDAIAVVWEGEDGDVRRLSYAELRRLTDRLANALRSLGVGERDAVGIYMPMAPETVAAFYACAKLGAISLPIFSGFGAPAVAARLNDAEAKVLIAADGSLRRGRKVDMRSIAEEAAAAAPAVQHLLVWPRLGNDSAWDELLHTQPDSFETRAFDSEHPLFIGYTSGTTGRPKGAVHVHGGFLVKIAEEVAYQVDVRPGDTLFWVTDLGWIMGPWEIVGAHALGATVLLSEGAPDHPGPDRVWDLVERHLVTQLGVSPTLIRALVPHGAEHVARHDLSSLRILASTGEPWNPDPYDWLFRNAGGGRLPIINLSGGTEVGACFLSPLPVDELKPCSLGGPALGMDVDVWGPDGKPVAPGEVGELVCKQPWPAMTRGIWGDPERYLETYWGRWPDVWVHGDWASVDEDGSWFLYGRSDDTLSIAGKRLGPAEVESVLASHPDVKESAAVGVPDDVKGESLSCVVVLAPGATADDATAAELATLVTDAFGKAFRPARVVFVPDLPRTRSAKIVRRAVRASLTGEDPGDLSSLENPAALEAIREASS